MNSQEKAAKIAVIGAGMAGLTATQRLIAGGAHVTLIEKSHAAGGRAATLERDSFYLNQGPHALYKGGAAFEIFTQLNIAPAGSSPAPKRSLAILNGEALDLPVDPASIMVTKLLSMGEKMEYGMLMSNLSKVDQTTLQDVSLSTWLSDTVKSERVQDLFKAMVRLGTYCNNPDKMSAAAAIQQLVIALQRGVLYLDHGWQSLVDAMLQLIRSQANSKQDANLELDVNLGLDANLGQNSNLGQDTNLSSLVEIYSAEVTALTLNRESGKEKIIVTINGEKHTFDAVVLALPPKQVSRLLKASNKASGTSSETGSEIGSETSSEISSEKSSKTALDTAGLQATLDNILPSHAACLDVCLKQLPVSENTFAVGIDQPLYYSVHSNTAKLAESDHAMIHLAVYLPEGATGGAEQENQLLALLDMLQPGWQKELVYKRFLPNMSASFGTATAAANSSNGLATVTLPGVPNVYVCGDWVGSGHLLLDAAMHSAVAAAEAALSVVSSDTRATSAGAAKKEAYA